MKNSILTRLKSILSNQKNIFIDEPMKKHTSFRVGGNADILVKPSNLNELSTIIKLLKETSTPYYIIGNGSNLLVTDKGIRGVVIKITNNFNNYYISSSNDKTSTLYVEAGTLLPSLSSFCTKAALSGLEFASGIPGTIGGALSMNAGAYGGEMKDIVLSVTVLDSNGDILKLTKDDMKFEYRNSIINKNNYVILSCELLLNKGNYIDISTISNQHSQKRISSQPTEYPSAGSTFKRPLNDFAGRLIEECGLKGFSINNAQVSSKHAGFIINKGKATSKDLLDLINYVKNEVYKKHKIELKEEVRILGEI
ncbi:MAG: UDP-N-acetylmuramate dehydrogenase [Romboutsia sp.]|nr:UDP-N-acetylmuramate dehydrogenase [Romboutsia sp.]